MLRLKHSFFCNLWPWSKLFSVPSPISIVEFENRLGSF